MLQYIGLWLLSRFYRSLLHVKPGRADDLGDPILCPIRIDLCVLQDRADEGRAPASVSFRCSLAVNRIVTWVEYGLGVNFNLTPATYFWADVERTSGGVLDEDWRATVGVRHAF